MKEERKKSVNQKAIVSTKDPEFLEDKNQLHAA
jgi:hypothetical protein